MHQLRFLLEQRREWPRLCCEKTCSTAAGNHAGADALQSFVRLCDPHPHAAFAVSVCLPSLLIALWPIWGLVTIPIMIVLSMASCLGPNLLPF